jgi:hypothetical protein
MTTTTFRHRLPGGRQPALQRQRGPLFVELLRPLRMWALIAFVLTAWPLLQFVWLALLAGGCVWLVARTAIRPQRSVTNATRPAPPARAAAPSPRKPANTISRTSGRLPRR